MNNKEFISELSRRLDNTPQNVSRLVESLLAGLTEQLQDDNSITIHGFGSFEVKKKAERISVNPMSKERMLIPPKLVLTYKPSNILKEKFK